MDTMFLTSILAGGMNNPNFFNGRILTAQDLRDLQTSGLLRSRRLGLALGEGVAYGLFAGKQGDTQLTISAGLAVNRRGDALLLPEDNAIPMQTAAQVLSPSADSPFQGCAPDSITNARAPGYFLLAITYAVQPSREQAPHSGLNSGYLVCTSRYETEGVQFKLVPLENLFTAADPENLRRSRLAGLMFGIATLRTFANDPFQLYAAFGLADQLRSAGRLLDCDVPLAVLHWTGTRLRFVDSWAARRAPAAPAATTPFPLQAPSPEPFPQHVSARRYVEAQAVFQQFQAQLAEISDPPNASVETNFSFLPAAGYLPLGAGKFSLARFFPRNTNTPRQLDPAFVRLLFHDSFFIEPVAVVPGQPVAVDFFHVTGAPESFVIFARREPILVQPEKEAPEAVEEAQPQPETGQDGTILVTVSGPANRVLRAADIQEVSVVSGAYTQRGLRDGGVYRYDQATGYKSYAAGPAKSYARQAYMRLGESAESRPGTGAQAGGQSKQATEQDKTAAYYFFTRPPGKYTVSVVPKSRTGLLPRSVLVTLRPGDVRHVEIALIRASGKKDEPGRIDVRPEDPYVILDGYGIDDIYLDPKWKELVDWPAPVDPDDWWTDPPRRVIEQVEEILAGIVNQDPRIVVEDPAILVNPGYSPDVISDDPYAFVRTKDGSLFPVILAADKNAVKGQAGVELAGLAEVDAAARGGKLHALGLTNVNALGGAWGSLAAIAFSTSAAGAKSLTGEVVGRAREMQNNFSRHAGVSPEANTSLKAAGITDDVILANSSTESVLSALNASGQNYSQGFALRLIEKARLSVPQETWALEAIGIDPGQAGILSGLGIESVGEFVAAAGSSPNELKDALNLSDSALRSRAETAQAYLIAGKVREAGRAGVANVQGVTADIGAGLVKAGVKTVQDLVAADPAALAVTVGVPEAEMRAIVSNAGERAGTLDILRVQFGLQEAEVDGMRAAGVVTLFDAANRADVMTNVVGAERSGLISSAAGAAMNVRLIRGFS
jgi:hypothetical protein